MSFGENGLPGVRGLSWRGVCFWGQRNWMTSRLPSCYSFGELETMSMGQKFVSRSVMPIWTAICTNRKSSLWKSFFILLGYVTISLEGKGKPKPPTSKVLNSLPLQDRSTERASHPARDRTLPFHLCIASKDLKEQGTQCKEGNKQCKCGACVLEEVLHVFVSLVTSGIQCQWHLYFSMRLHRVLALSNSKSSSSLNVPVLYHECTHTQACLSTGLLLFYSREK